VKSLLNSLYYEDWPARCINYLGSNLLPGSLGLTLARKFKPPGWKVVQKCFRGHDVIASNFKDSDKLKTTQHVILITKFKHKMPANLQCWNV